MESFAGRGPAAAACGDDGGGDRRFPEPPTRHARAEDSSAMLVIRDALLSQLQKDRLRQEIILAELAKIERAMALRSADAERANPVAPFPFLEEETPHSSEVVGRADYGIVAAGVQLESQKPATDDLVRECLKSSCGAGNAAGQQNGALDETKLQGPNETTLPKKTTPSLVKWSCDICRVEAPTESHLQQHFAGQKHRSKVAALVSRNDPNSQKAKAPAAKSENVRQYDQKPRLSWICRFCQSNCTCKSNLDDHLRGKRHKAKIQSLLEECKNMALNYGSLNSQPNIVTLDEESNPASTWNCSLCQAKCSRQSELANHLRGKRHQLNFLVLQVEGKQYLSEWGCGICQAKCNSVSQFENHCSSRGHQQKVEAPRRGGQISSSTGSKTAKGASSEETDIHRVTYFCKLCDLHCNSKNTLAEHRKGKKHTEKVEQRMSLSFCEICNLQCNSEKMLAHHRTGKGHLSKLNN
ncbi:hypothetical protein BDA96_02G215600 [Sorghum bicolor]|uniref:C2H2-type domain-containing protein n=1 Tax=Sorghum bicolor TaxID=4558 RepID=A0A921UT91_SORBI|nr:hypothetical protein BDA96_02G215600 [Sorghum bicolor]